MVCTDKTNGVARPANTRETSFEIADVIIDFTSPKALFSFTESAVAKKTGLVVGTTGLEKQHFNLLKQTGNSTKVFYAPNMSFYGFPISDTEHGRLIFKEPEWQERGMLNLQNTPLPLDMCK